MAIVSDKIDINSINYRISGKGPRLVLVHPVGLDLTFFDSLVESLEQRYRVLRFDLRGHGNTPPKIGIKEARVADYAYDLHALLRQLDFFPSAVAGFSFGGMIAQELALNFPDDITALIVSACASTFDDSTRKLLKERGTFAEREGMQAIVAATIQRWFSAEFHLRKDYVSVRTRLLTNDVESWKQAWFAMSELNTLPRLHTITVPTLCLAAGEDLSVPPLILQDIADRIPGARFVVLANLPHMLFIEDPKRTATAIAGFLNDALRKEQSITSV